MIPKLAVVFLVVALSALLVALDYQHGNRVTPVPTQKAQSSTKALQLTLEPVDVAKPATSLQAFRGRFVLLNAWATWCPPCVHEFPMLIELAKQHPERLQLVTLSADRTREAAQRFLEGFEPLSNAYHAYDAGGKQAREILQIYRYPESLLLSPEGELIAKYAGVLSEQDLQEIVQRLNVQE